MLVFEKYGPSTILQLLSTTFTATNEKRLTFFNATEIELPYFYQSADTIVFPPVSDREGSMNLETISIALTKAAALLKAGNLLGKKLLFPVVEEQPAFFGFFGGARNHWVTLHYDPDTQTATVIDSIGLPIIGGIYSTTAMQTSFLAGLRELGLAVQQFNVSYQSIQTDATRCGAWTAINIELLANGTSVADLLLTLTAEDRDRVVQHNQHKIATGKNPGLYQPQKNIHRSDSDVTVSTQDTTTPASDLDDQEIDDCMFPDDTIIDIDTDENKAQREALWIETATQLVQNGLSNPNALLIALIDREGITNDGRKLSDQLLGNTDAESICSALESTYQHYSSVQTQRRVRPQGYGIFDPSRLGSGLRTIGFDEETISTLKLSDMIKYDAVFSSAINNAGNETFYAEYMPTIDCEQTLHDMTKAHNDFKIKLYASLKRIIENGLKKAADIRHPLNRIENEQITVNFNDRDGVTQRIFIDPSYFFSNQHQHAEIMSLIRSRLKASGSNGHLVIDVVSPQQTAAIRPLLSHPAGETKVMTCVTKQDIYSELSALKSRCRMLTEPFPQTTPLERPIAQHIVYPSIPFLLPELKTKGQKHSFLADFDTLRFNMKNALSYVHTKHGESLGIIKLNNDISTLLNEIESARMDYANDKCSVERLYLKLTHALNKGQDAIQTYPERSVCEWFSELIHNFGVLLIQLVNQYIFAQPDGPADYRDSKAATEMLVNERTKTIATYRDQMHTFFAERDVTFPRVRFPSESSERMCESPVPA